MVLSLDSWASSWASLGAVAPAPLRDELLARYAEPHRAYHTLQHLQECLTTFAAVADTAVRPDEVRLALWFHDAIYDTAAKDNEAESAKWARAALMQAGVAEAVADRVHELVMATVHDAVPSENDAMVLVDVDLSILGADDRRFAEYERQIRVEYGWVPDDLYRDGRGQVLRAFLARPKIFGSAWFLDRLEARARANLGRALSKL